MNAFRRLFLGTLVSLAGTLHAAPPANLLTNGSFETGSMSGWSNSGATVVTGDTHPGTYAARFTTGSCVQTFATVPGQSYKVTTWLHITAETVTDANNDWGGFKVDVSDYATWATLAELPQIRATEFGSGWFKIALRFTAPANTARLTLSYFGGAGRSMTVLADDVQAFVVPATNTAPTLSAALTPGSIASLPTTQTFNATTDDIDGAVNLVNWDFGDGTFAQSAGGTRRVATPGSYTATVRVRDDDGAVASAQFAYTVADPGFPGVTIASPGDGATVTATPLTVNGTASGTAPALALSTDRGWAGTPTGTTTWSANVPLLPGWNRVLAQVRDAAGRIATVERRVRYVPVGPLAIGGITETATTIERWTPFEVAFDLLNSAATHPQFPYDPAPAPGLEFIDGASVDAVFTNDGGRTLRRLPAFRRQPWRRELRDNKEWMIPEGTARWVARFAPPTTGTWQYWLEAVEQRGTATSEIRTFTVTPAAAANHGPVQPSTRDLRLYEFADGTPFVGSGFGLGAFDRDKFSYDAESKFTAIGGGNATYFRWWAPGLLWANSWQPWSSRTLRDDGTVPPFGLSLDAAYASALGAVKLDVDPANWTEENHNPVWAQGFVGESASLTPGKTYRVRVRWRTDALTGPADAAKPYGVVVKFTDWPEPNQTGVFPVVIPHVAGDTPWHVAWKDFTATQNYAKPLVVCLENVTGGRAFVDELAIQEVPAGGGLGPPLNGLARFAGHLEFDERHGEAMDTIYRAAQQRGLNIRMLVAEKKEWSLNHLAPGGFRDPVAAHFNEYAADAATRRLHEYYWRHLAARFGAFRSFQGLELVNEEAPGPTDHFRLAAVFARFWKAQANPKPATTSTSSTLGESGWKAPFAADIPATDFHAYPMNTWLRSYSDLTYLFDSATYYRELADSAQAAGFGKPVHWGECSLYTTGWYEHPALANDTTGVWLHKFVWARTGFGWTYPTYWNADNIWLRNLHWRYGNWMRFTAGMPLGNGRFGVLNSTSTNANLRAYGQADPTHGLALVWVNNETHTWRAALTGAQPDPQPSPALPAWTAQSGTITVTLGAAQAGKNFLLSRYDTSTGLVTNSADVTADGAGAIPLMVTNLSTDTAWRLEPATPVVWATIVSDDANAAKGGAAGRFRFERAGGDITAPLTLSFTLGGTAIAGGDFVATPTTVTFAAGQRLAWLDLTPRDTPQPEETRSIALTITPAAGYAVGALPAPTLMLTDTGYGTWAKPIASAPARAFLSDPDGDRLANTLEFVLGMDAQRADTTPGGVVSWTGDQHLQLQFHVVARAVAQFDVRVEASTDLVSWTNLWQWSPAVAAHETRVARNDGFDLTVRDPADLTGASRRFLRIVATPRP